MKIYCFLLDKELFCLQDDIGIDNIRIIVAVSSIVLMTAVDSIRTATAMTLRPCCLPEIDSPKGCPDEGRTPPPSDKVGKKIDYEMI